MSKKLVRILGFFAVLIGLFSSSFSGGSLVANQQSVSDQGSTRTLSTSPDIDSTWRHTKYGWQDSVSWPSADSFAPTKTVELLHPLVWAGIVLTAVAATMIWASNEWEIARLFAKDKTIRRPADRAGQDQV